MRDEGGPLGRVEVDVEEGRVASAAAAAACEGMLWKKPAGG